MDKIDIHCHTTNRPVADVYDGRADPAAIHALMRAHDIEETVLLATYFPHKGTGISNFRLQHWLRGLMDPCASPRLSMFGSLDMEHYFRQGLNELDELATLRAIKGIKLYTGYQRIDLPDEKTRKVIGLAQRHRLPMMFHCGYSHGSMREYGTPAITDCVKASDIAFIPRDHGVPVIAAHLAKPHIDDLIATLKRDETGLLRTDTSGLFLSKHERDELPDAIESVRRVVGECGPGRVLFGTDFPLQTHEDAITIIEEAMRGYPTADREKVYYGNARDLLGGAA